MLSVPVESDQMINSLASHKNEVRSYIDNATAVQISRQIPQERIMDREGVLGRWPSVGLSLEIVIKQKSNSRHGLIDRLKRRQVHTRLPQSKQRRIL